MSDEWARRPQPRAPEDVAGEGFMVMASMVLALLAEGAEPGAGEEEPAVASSAGFACLGTAVLRRVLVGAVEPAQ